MTDRDQRVFDRIRGPKGFTLEDCDPVLSCQAGAALSNVLAILGRIDRTQQRSVGLRRELGQELREALVTMAAAHVEAGRSSVRAHPKIHDDDRELLRLADMMRKVHRELEDLVPLEPTPELAEKRAKLQDGLTKLEAHVHTQALRGWRQR